MCGIAGKLWLDPDRPGDGAVVAAMTAALAHRGPDGDGLAVDGPVALGHRRLSIVDLSERGAQPMADARGELLLVANGEIYNHAALRRELAAHGHRFASDCDVEVVLAAYRQWWDAEGPAFVDRLDGMLAFALWDGPARRLVLARDRLGQKPLHYALTDRALVFASELPALARDPSVDRTPDDAALADYLAFRCVPQPRTAWRGAAKLPPATVAVVEDGRLTTHRYWRLSPGVDGPAAPTLDEAAEEVAGLLDAAVERRLMADVPVGALLSGGVDSGAVVGLMARHAERPVQTFTIGFDDPDYDETREAANVARLFGCAHEQRRVAPDAVALLDRIVAQHGEPFADSSAIPTFLVSELAGSRVKVVLTGDGGDESFAGYDRHRALELARRWDGAPLRAGLGAAAALARALPAGGHRSLSTRLQRFAAALSAPPRERNHLWRLGTGHGRLLALLTDEGRRRLGTPSHYGPAGGGDLPLNEALVLDVENYLPDDILVKVDIASMAHGLEARSPFLDRWLMEFVATLPASLKLAGGRGKAVLRRAVRRLLPRDVLDGPKRGFGVPLDAWFRGPLLAHAREVLLDPACAARGLLDTAAVARLLDAHAARELAAHDLLYTLLVLERWHQHEDATS